MPSIVGICTHDLHPGEVDEATFEYKGCWSCEFFRFLDDSPLLSRYEVAHLFGVTPQTVSRWVKKCLLKGRVFKRIRWTGSLNPPVRKLFIYRDSVEKFSKSKWKRL